MSELSPGDNPFENDSAEERENVDRQISSAKGPVFNDGESPLSWAEKKEFILENFDERIESSIDLRKVLESVSLKDSEQEVLAKLADCMEVQKKRFSPETIEGMERFKIINKELKELERKSDKIRDLYKDEDGDFDYDELEKNKEYIFLDEKIEALYEEITLLRENLNIEFLLKFERMISDMSNKNKYIRDTLSNGGEDKFKKEFLKRANMTHDSEGDYIKEEDIQKVTVEPFDVIFDINRESKVCVGRYYSDSPFISVFKARPGKRSFVVGHEKVHNALNSAGIGHDVPRGFEKFLKSYETYKKYTESSMYGVLVENQVRILKKFNQFDFIDEHHEEIVAAIEEASALDFRVGHSWLANFLKASMDKDHGFKDKVGAFATAGNRIIKNDKRFAEMVEEESDPQIKKLLQDLKERFESGTISVIGKIEEATKIAGALGSDAKDELFVLFMMLPPTKYRHIKPYFENHYGKEEVSKKVENKNLIDSFNFTGPEIKELFAKMANGDIVLDAGDKEYLSDILKNFDVGDKFDSLKIYTLEEINEYMDSVEKIGKILGVKKLPEDFESRAFGQFFYNILREFTASQFKDLPEMYEKLNVKQRKIFVGILESYVGNFIEDDLNANGVEISSIEEIKKMPLWDTIQKIGLEKKVSKTIEEMIENQAAWNEKQKEK